MNNLANAMNPRIYITGASCAGVSTLGKALANALQVVSIDCDDFYWMPTDPPYTQKRPPADRVKLIRIAQGNAGWVLSGSFDGWGDPLIDQVTLILFVTTPTPVRMKRLLAREHQRYGDRISPGNDMHAIHTAFAEWAAQYDNPQFDGRNRARHEAWLAQQSAPVLRLDGTIPTANLVDTAIGRLRNTMEAG